MSDETQPTPLRLKSRLHTDGGSPAQTPQSPAAQEPPPAPAESAEGGIRLRLKPKLAVSAPAEEPPALIPASIPEPAAEIPAVICAPEPPSVPETPPVPAAEPQESENTAPPPPPDPEPVASLPVGAPKIPHIKAPEQDIPMPEPSSPYVAPQHKGLKLGFVAVILICAVLAIVAAFLAWKIFGSDKPVAPMKPAQLQAPSLQRSSMAPRTPVSDLNAPAPKPATPEEKPAVAVSAPPVEAAAASKPAVVPAVAPEPAPTPGTSTPAASLKTPVNRTQAVIAKRVENEVSPVNTLVAAEPRPDPTPSTPPPIPAPAIGQTPPPTPQAAAPELLFPENAQPALPKGPPQASTAFKRFVNDAAIKGVFQGKIPRALINGRTIVAGEVVDKTLGITFEGINADKKTITFKDASGATVTRRY